MTTHIFPPLKNPTVGKLEVDEELKFNCEGWEESLEGTSRLTVVVFEREDKSQSSSIEVKCNYLRAGEKLPSFLTPLPESIDFFKNQASAYVLPDLDPSYPNVEQVKVTMESFSAA